MVVVATRENRERDERFEAAKWWWNQRRSLYSRDEKKGGGDEREIETGKYLVGFRDVHLTHPYHVDLLYDLFVLYCGFFLHCCRYPSVCVVEHSHQDE